MPSDLKNSYFPGLFAKSGKPIPFSPNQLPGINVWLDASNSAYFTLVGPLITNWKNLAPGGTDYAIQTASPALEDAVQNGLSAVMFDASTLLQALGNNTDPLFTDSSGFYMACVIKPTAEPSVPLFFAVNNPMTTQFTGFAVSSSGAYGDIMLNASNGTGDGLPMFRSPTPNGFNVDILNQCTQMGFTYDGSGFLNANVSAFDIRFQESSLVIGSAASVGTQNGVNTVGSWGGNGNRINGYVMEVIFCAANVSPSLVAKTEAYLKAKWNL